MGGQPTARGLDIFSQVEMRYLLRVLYFEKSFARNKKLSLFLQLF